MPLKTIDLVKVFQKPEDYKNETYTKNSIILKDDVTEPGCLVLSIRGVESIDLQILEEINEMFDIQMTSEQWIKESTTRYYLVLVVVIPIMVCLFKFFEKGWF